MPVRKILAPPAEIDFDAIRHELAIPDGYPAGAVADAVAAAVDPPTTAISCSSARSDERLNHSVISATTLSVILDIVSRDTDAPYT